MLCSETFSASQRQRHGRLRYRAPTKYGLFRILFLVTLAKLSGLAYYHRLGIGSKLPNRPTVSLERKKKKNWYLHRISPHFRDSRLFSIRDTPQRSAGWDPGYQSSELTRVVKTESGIQAQHCCSQPISAYTFINRPTVYRHLDNFSEIFSSSFVVCFEKNFSQLRSAHGAVEIVKTIETLKCLPVLNDEVELVGIYSGRRFGCNVYMNQKLTACTSRASTLRN